MKKNASDPQSSNDPLISQARDADILNYANNRFYHILCLKYNLNESNAQSFLKDLWERQVPMLDSLTLRGKYSFQHQWNLCRNIYFADKVNIHINKQYAYVLSQHNSTRSANGDLDEVVVTACNLYHPLEPLSGYLTGNEIYLLVKYGELALPLHLVKDNPCLI